MTDLYAASLYQNLSKKRSYSTSPSFDYIPALDGLRAVSIILVMVAHFGFGKYVPGLLGVTIFFFVSGLLITRQLLGELGSSDTISLPRFYMRRLLRLYPGLLAMVVIGSSLFMLVGIEVPRKDVLAAIFYWENYYHILDELSSAPSRVEHPFAMLWSLAVEEHYYLIFPSLVLLFGHRRTRFAGLIVAGIVAVTLWRMHIASMCYDPAAPCRWLDRGYNYAVYATDTRLDLILYGALLATLLGSRAVVVTLRVLRSRSVLLISLALLLVSLILRDLWFRETLRFTLQGVGLFFCVGALLFTDKLSSLRGMLSHRSCVLVGRWSYSLYLWHGVVLAIAGALLPEALQIRNDVLPGFLWLVTVFPTLLSISFAAAIISYYGIERPMLALRRRFGSKAVEATAVDHERTGTLSPPPAAAS